MKLLHGVTIAWLFVWLHFAAMTRDIAPFGLRIPADLKSKIERAAAEGKRSINSETIARIEKSFDQQELAEYSDGELIAELMRRYSPGEIYIRIGKLKEGD